MWNSNNERVSSIKVSHQKWFSSNPKPPCIRSIDVLGKLILVGMSDSSISTIEMDGHPQNLIVTGHDTINDKEVWGLAMHPLQKNIYATCSFDGTLRIWDANSKSLVNAVDVTASLEVCEYHPQGKVIITGGRDKQV
jgi:WD40 repeat protein